MTRPLCPDCGHPMEDEGIGSYEYWGQRCVDTQWVCEHCASAEDFRVWPDGTVQAVSEGEPHAWMSDDYETVSATSEEEALERAGVKPFKPNGVWPFPTGSRAK